MVRLGFMPGESDGLFHPEVSITVEDYLTALEKLESKLTQQNVINGLRHKFSLDSCLDLHTATSLTTEMGYLEVNWQFLRNDIIHSDRLTKGETAAFLYKLYFLIIQKQCGK
ncbi:hypothetical protein BKP37_06260 [Anaerobacillus alkalilacustris]|uniref:SLH domain-containing protein n=1 Tax=Anaerobacillus alkalilacustris TaxID=393763 RepID=A0A1S2LW14_9BACI|nr:hypothetical protein [Anaerobacillus alkalilacustris]OIJ16363.1 hypothetical protein BKP37_06260 [Anaerobacillus alkalilacustris]